MIGKPDRLPAVRGAMNLKNTGRSCMGNRKLLLVGGGGHCRSVLDCVLRSGAYDAIGIVEREGAADKTVLGVPVVGYDADLPRLLADGWQYAAVTLGSIGVPTRRRALCQQLKALGFQLPVLTDPSAVISSHAELAEGTFVGKRAVINAGSSVGVCAILNTGSVLEHDCTVGGFVHVSPGAVLCGAVQAEANAHIGAGAVVMQGVRIGHDSIIGAGSVIIRDVPADCTVVGNPGRILERT